MERGNVWELSVQFLCKPKTALRNKNLFIFLERNLASNKPFENSLLTFGPVAYQSGFSPTHIHETASHKRGEV